MPQIEVKPNNNGGNNSTHSVAYILYVSHLCSDMHNALKVCSLSQTTTKSTIGKFYLSRKEIGKVYLSNSSSNSLWVGEIFRSAPTNSDSKYLHGGAVAG